MRDTSENKVSLFATKCHNAMSAAGLRDLVPLKLAHLPGTCNTEIFPLPQKNKAILHFTGYNIPQTRSTHSVVSLRGKKCRLFFKATRRKATASIALCRLWRLCRENRINRV